MGLVGAATDALAVSDRDRILQAMADSCAEIGYRATTIDDLLDRAAVDRDRFDSLFAGKEDCAVAALNMIVSETLARISTTEFATGPDPARRTHEARAILELLVTRANFARLATIDSRQGGSQRMHSAYESAARVLALMLERAGGGAEGPHERTAARAALGGIEALVRRELSIGRAADLPVLLPNFVYATLVPFVGQREALQQARRAAIAGVAEEE